MDAASFGRALTRRAVARACMQSLDQVGVESRALELLTDFTELYMEKLLERAKELCEGSGRSECNIFDLKVAFPETGNGPKTISELIAACERQIDISRLEEDVLPDVQSFPVERAPRVPPRATVASLPLPDAVPDFFPPFPEAFTFRHTHQLAVERRDSGRLKRQLVQNVRQGKDALAHIQASSL